MKIYFHKHDDNVSYVIGSEPGGSAWWDGLKIDDTAADMVKNLLKNRFESIMFNESAAWVFKFADEADEAEFLLWSNNGIDV